MQCEWHVHMYVCDAKMDLFSHHGLKCGKFCDILIADRVCTRTLDDRNGVHTWLGLTYSGDYVVS